jgi:5-methylcytosine-specific restriction endonuclease McrA
MAVLALDISGIPRTWVSHDEAISYHAKNLVAWSLGDVIARYRGGIQRNGEQSYIETPSIIAVKGAGFTMKKQRKVVLTNPTLFARDRHICGYCGNHFVSSKDLSRDHIVPRFHGGLDEWTNVVTACFSCNQKKGCKTLKDSGMELRYVPYEPNHYEALILRNRNILADQMEYLISGVPKHSRILQVAA